MTTMLAPGQQRTSRPRSTAPGRAMVVVLLIAGLIAAAYTRDWATAEHARIRDRARPGGRATDSDSTSLSSMPSFATALLLGGLRGPLVMILWTSSEDQKQQHDLQDFDTKVEWIRLLQPEFDTVHLFEIWNKAYNISVQMASLRDKYTTILDAIDYGQKVEQQRRDDINILTAVAQIYGDKLGGSQEHEYYRARVRRETQTLTRVHFPPDRAGEFRALAGNAGWIEDASPITVNERTRDDQVLIEPIVANQISSKFKGPGVGFATEDRPAARRNDPSWRRVRLDPMLDQRGFILPDLLKPRFPRPANLPASQPWYDGSTLQFLKRYQPFPYGLSTYALAYNDYRRAQYLLLYWDEHHIQIGDTVVDARPALTLESWGKDEWERGRRYELRMRRIYVPDSADLTALEQPNAAMPYDQAISDSTDRDAAIYSYGLAARLFADARTDFGKHMKRFEANASVYFAHVDDCQDNQVLMQADHDYLAANAAAGSQRQKLLESAGLEYRDAIRFIAINILKYYVDEAVMSQTYPIDPHTSHPYNRATIESVNPTTYLKILSATLAANERYFTDPVTHQYSEIRDTYHDDREPYLAYIAHCQARLNQLRSAGIVFTP